MQNEDWIRKRLERIESHVFHIEILLIILMSMYLLTFYGMLDFVIKVILWVGVIIGLIYLVMLLIDKITSKKTRQIMDKQFQEMIEKAKAEQHET